MSDKKFDGEQQLEWRIRDRAYRLWEEEGRPEGRELEHWQMARELVAQQDSAGMATKPNPAAEGIDRATRDEPVEPLLAVENLGDLPGLTDQGEESAYPKPRTPARRRKPSTATKPSAK
jgi:hypothetical protein